MESLRPHRVSWAFSMISGQGRLSIVLFQVALTLIVDGLMRKF